MPQIMNVKAIKMKQNKQHNKNSLQNQAELCKKRFLGCKTNPNILKDYLRCLKDYQRYFTSNFFY
jgi:hypothetical protein